MAFYTDPPSLRAFKYDKPSLLVCWWITIFCALLILIRLTGRFVRTERLFREDRIAAGALLPLFLRMGCVHFILTNGTNNSDFSNVQLTTDEITKKSIASGLVLASRILFTSTLWIFKFAILEFLQRLTGITWKRGHNLGLMAIRWTLLVTFVIIVISNFIECQPFNHYWQVLPDPGGRCRQGYAWLVAMATSNIITDVMLVIFPVPIIFSSNMKLKRKIPLVLLFSLGLSVVAITCYRLPHVIEEHGRQQYRSLLASIELLFATVSANALVLGSFVRDRGVKKQKFHRTSTTESMDRKNQPSHPMRHEWGSDEDLFRDVGLGLGAGSRGRRVPRHDDPPAITYQTTSENTDSWQFPTKSESTGGGSESPLLSHTGPRRLSFFDVGGLLEENEPSSFYHHQPEEEKPCSPTSWPTPHPSASVNAGSGGFRRGSTALLQDLGGLFTPAHSRPLRSREPKHIFAEQLQESEAGSSSRGGPVLQDAGGLLN